MSEEKLSQKRIEELLKNEEKLIKVQGYAKKAALKRRHKIDLWLKKAKEKGVKEPTDEEVRKYMDEKGV